MFHSSRSRFTAIRFFTGREIKRFSSSPPPLPFPHGHPFYGIQPVYSSPVLRSCPRPGVDAARHPLSQAFSFTPPPPPLRNNEVTVLNVSRTGDHREWGAKSPSTPCLVTARKGKGQFENRAVKLYGGPKMLAALRKGQDFFQVMATLPFSSLSLSPPPSIVEFHHPHGRAFLPK